MSISTNLADLNKVVQLYQLISGKTDEEVLQKQGGKLGYAVYKALRGIRPAKGSIRTALLARLAAHKGIRVRQYVKDAVLSKIRARAVAGKRPSSLNPGEEMIKAEIGLREKGIGVLAQSIHFPAAGVTDGLKMVSRYGTLMSQVELDTKTKIKYVKFDWTGISKLSSRVVEGLHGPRGEKAIEDAILGVKADIADYIRPRLKANATAAMRALVK